jgi:Mrp family chromosome partitioning ATPase
MKARATNALRRPAAIVVTGVTLAALALMLLLLVPGRATRASTAVAARIPDRPDSTTALQVRQQATRQIATADSLLQLARSDAMAPEPEIIDTIPPHLIPRREELIAAVNGLSALISRTNSVPLPSSYRALGESPLMTGVPGVPELLDSLARVERERELLGAMTGADPMYISLTARAGEIGRSIAAAAVLRRAALRAELAPLLPARPPPRPVLVIDTLQVLAQREEARGYLLGADEELTRIRTRHAEIDELERRARELREVGAPLSATLAAAIVIGLALGFGLVLLLEMRVPRIADAREAEVTAGVRVMAIARPRIVIPERDRRRSDIAVPENLDPFAEHYRSIYLHITTREEPLTNLAITGDEPEVAALVGVNVAAFDVREARSAIVVDTDPLTAGVARALEVPSEPGLRDVLSGATAWTDAIQYVPIGRDQVLAVMPSGRRSGQPSPELAERVRADLTRLASRHDLIVFVTAVDQARVHPTTVLLSRDVVLCARLGHTRVKRLREMMKQLRAAEMTVHGLVLWGAEPPDLEKARGAVSVPRGAPEPAAV